MAAGNVLDATRDPKLALEWVGDRDLKQMKSYLLRREDRLRLAAEAVATTQSATGYEPEVKPKLVQETVPEPSLNTNAPVRGAVNDNDDSTYGEPPVGIEPTTARLRIECSTAELRWPSMPWRGLEPRRLAAPPPQDGVSTNSTTRALWRLESGHC